MANETYYSAQVTRVEDIPTKAKNTALCMEFELSGVPLKTVALDNEGKSKRNDVFAFSQSDIGAGTFIVRLKNPSGLIGHAMVDARELPPESTEKDLQRDLHSKEKRNLFFRKRPKKVGNFTLRLKSIDSQTRAENELKAAEQSVVHIETLVNKRESRDEVIGAVIAVTDGIIAVIDEIAEIHPVFNVTWKAVTALYKLVNHQIQNDAQLLELVEDMRTAFDFSKEADKLNDNTEMLRPKVKELLRETTDCSRFVLDYAKNLPRRMVQTSSTKTIEDFSKKFGKLRRDIDTAIGLNTNKEVHDIRSQQKLERLEWLEPVKSGLSSMSGRPRCLKGTRKEYLEQIMAFLSDVTYPNILWLTGAAGAGKSTIAVTAYDKCGARGCPPAYIFFEREKGDPNSVIRTVAYTLASDHPLTIGQHILEVLGQNKSICNADPNDQFQKLLLEPLRAASADVVGPIVIILDALDECGSAEQRRDLLRLLTVNFIELPRNVRILVTSRPEGDIMEELLRTDRIRRIGLKHDSNESKRDVDFYIHQEIQKALNVTELEGNGWNEKLQFLCNAADGLFIWASTAIKMLDGPVKMRERKLQRLVDDVGSVGGGIDTLYGTALEESGIWKDRDLRDAGTAILRFILVSKETVSGPGIAGLLELEEDTADAVLSQLRSLVLYEPGQSVRLHHASFADYLLSTERSGGKPWHISEAKAKWIVTERCFDIMAEKLRFNICNIESSFRLNSEVPGLEGRIANEVPSHLNYACRFWSVHMCELEKRDNLDRVRDKLRLFMKEKLLYWLEVLSLTKCFTRIAGRALNDASLWIEQSDEEISSYLHFAIRLVGNFALPISRSAPHIYLSAVSLWNGESSVAEHYSKTHPVVKVRTIGTGGPSQCIKVLQTGSDIHSIDVSRDGRLIACSSRDKRIRVWDIDSGELVSSDFEIDEEGVVAFSPCNKYIVSCSRERKFSVWDVGSRERTSTYSVNGWDSYWMRAERILVTFSANGKRVIAAHEATVYTLNFNDGTLYPIPDCIEVESCVEFRSVSTNGNYVVGAKDVIKAFWNTSTEGGKFAVWDLETGKQVSGWIATYIDSIMSFGVSSDGTRVATGSILAIHIWNVDSGDLVASSNRVHHVTSVAFFPDGKRVVTGNMFGGIAILHVDSGDIIWGPIMGHDYVIYSVKVSSNGKRVFSASSKDIRIWDINNATGPINSGSLDAHETFVNSVAFSSDGKRIVSGSHDKTVRIWDAGSGELLKGPFRGHERFINSVAFSPDGERVVSGSGDRTVRIWDANTGEQVLSLDGHEGWVWSVAFSADGKRIVSGSGDETICIWDANTGELVKNPLTGHATTVYSGSFSPDSKRVVSGSLSGTVRVWDVESGETVVGPLEGHSSSVHSVAFSQDGKRIASGSDDATIRVWNADSGALVSRLVRGHTRNVASISFSPNGECIASGSWDRTVCIWEVDTGNLVLGPLRGHENRVSSVSFSPDGNRVVSGSWDGTIRVWDVSSKAVEPRRSEGCAADSLPASSSSPSADTGAKPCGERTFLDWGLHKDGWVKGNGGELLTWIPEDRRATLCRARNTAVFSCRFSTKLDFSNAPLGEKWADGYPLRN